MLDRMASTQEVGLRQHYRDRSGRLLGWCERSGNRIHGRDRTGYLLGWYDIARNETRDRAGRLIGRGDMLAALIIGGS